MKSIHTLFEAFILVVLVVFLFLGNVRATLIPMIAVPVSLIGTFAVLLALGYSANTISMFAMILAIGIVVDDAIVVVESVEHKLENHGSARPGEAVKAAMREITAPIIAITLVLLSVFVPVGFHSRHHRPALPAIRRHGVGRDAAVGHQRPDAEPRAVRAPAAARTFQPAASWRRVSQGHRHGARRLTATSSPVWSASRFSVSCSSASSALATYFFVQGHAGGFLPEEDQGAFFIECGCRTAQRRPDHGTPPTRWKSIIGGCRASRT